MDKRKIILDCDPGHDDAVAIMLAAKSPQIDLLGITVVAGNVGENNGQCVECVPISGAGYSGVRRMRTAHDTG